MANKKIYLFIVLFLAFFGFFILRLINLNAIPVFVDEGIYVRWSQIMRSEATLRFLPLSDGKQPLFMWLTIPFLKFNSDPLIAGRLVSVFAGLGSIVVVSLISWILFNDLLIASTTGLLYSVLPFAVFFDRMALADSLLGFFGLTSILLSLIFAKTGKLEHAMFLGFSIGGGLLTKSPALIFYLWTVFVLIFSSKITKKTIYKYLIGLLTAVIISQAIYSILRLGPGFSQIGARNQDYVFSIKEVLSHPLNPFIGNIKNTISWVWLLFTPPVVITIVLAFVQNKKRSPLYLLLLLSLFPLLGQASIAKVYTSRYILYAVLPLIPIAGWGIAWLLYRRGPLIRSLGILAILTPLVLSVMYVLMPANAPMSFDMRNGYLEEWTAGWGQKEVANYLIDQETKGNKVVVFTEGYFGTLPDGLQIYTEGHPNIVIVGSPPNVTKLPEGLVNTSKDNLRYFVLNRSRNHLSNSDLSHLTLIKEFPKPVRVDGNQEVLQFFEFE